MSDKLSKKKILNWIYNGNASGFTIGEFTSLINLGYFNAPSIADGKVLEIAGKCADLNLYQDDEARW